MSCASCERIRKRLLEEAARARDRARKLLELTRRRKQPPRSQRVDYGVLDWLDEDQPRRPP